MTKGFTAMCMGLALAALAAPVGAQQTPPSETTQPSVPPAPPPELPPPPPFPPMPSARPSHRWVDAGEHRPRHHATNRASQTHTSHHRRARHQHSAPNPAAATMRRCASMSTHRMLRDRVCSALVHAYHQAIKPTHHKASHRAAHHRRRR